MKSIYFFGGNTAEGDSTMRELLGGKGANLAEMCKIGIPVPPGFTITTNECNLYYKNGKKLSLELLKEIENNLKKIEKTIGKQFGSELDPLLVSVRSGARASMPGMMDTILNLGLNDKTVLAIGKQTENMVFAMDSYRRFIQMYSSVVLNIDHDSFETMLQDLKFSKKYKQDSDLTQKDLESLIDGYKEIVRNESGNEFPQDTQRQLENAIEAVFSSWMNDRAITYRRLYNIPESWGTAVNVQSMVFGNMGNESATGVAFTRNPSTGEKVFYGEFLVNAQGEDVVAGIRTPNAINNKSKNLANENMPSMEEVFPQTYQQLCQVFEVLEGHYKDMQDVEFTVENSKLWILQTRNGKRAAKGEVKIAFDMVKEGLITKIDAIKRINPSSLDQLLHKTINPKANKNIITRGLPASPGAAVGTVVFSSIDAEMMHSKGKKVVLVRHETSPEDIGGMYAAVGILTARGGMTSHAAVVARGMGKCCVSGAEGISINYEKQQFLVGSHVINAGDLITLDGSTGDVILGEVETVEPEMFPEFLSILSWCDELRKLQVRVNAETPLDCKNGMQFGAEGIGLCRTEHMFFSEDRISYVRQMILSETQQERVAPLEKLEKMQEKDFMEIFSIMGNLPVNIRLLDPPLHEFLPSTATDIEKTAAMMGCSTQKVESRMASLHEINPMLGHRGCRLGISYPEIYKMQAQAIFSAACNVVKNSGQVKLEVMLPLIINEKELKILTELVEDVAKSKIQSLTNSQKSCLSYEIGTMIEVPRACIVADKIAHVASYFSFGTNDLTQMTMGLSRDDAGSFIADYISNGIFEKDPFVTIDQDGVGEMIKMAAEKGRSVKPNIKLGICGEHGGDPDSISFCAKLNFTYVSCSPYRIPIARVAAARAEILKNGLKNG